ncbi:MAG: hypothetical protein DMG14_30750 [Acidobacteria bacterium]|nr:MAG: hypothetical protein DMG14_30750 [Acidobacteriota bacterium]
MDWEDLEYAVEVRGPDPQQIACRKRLRDFFESNEQQVFFANQLAVQNEKDFFHWITHRAIADLIRSKQIKTEVRQMKTGAPIRLLWHRGHRYFKRDAARVVRLVEEYSDPNVCAYLGLHGETMILRGFARKRFTLLGEHTREFRERTWERTDHNLDFVFERDEAAYGIEVKNALSYMDQKEFRIKIALCEQLGLRPIFAARMLPKTWIKELIDAGGYAMILKYQLYPWTHLDLARRVAKELGLPVDAPKALADGTMDRFERWHLEKGVN